MKEAMNGLRKANTLRELDEIKYVMMKSFEKLEELRIHISRNDCMKRWIREKSKNFGEIRFFVKDGKYVNVRFMIN